MEFDATALGTSFACGLILGGFYFFGLWWTIRNLTRLRAPALVIVVSFLVRSGIVMAGFYIVMADRWENLLMALAGFTLMRLWLVRRLQPAPLQARPEGLKEGSKG